MEDRYPPVLYIGCIVVPLFACFAFFMLATGQKAVEETVVQAKISHYWPPLGGVNCGRFVAGKCISRMASGKPWQDWVDLAVACPKEYPFGTKFVIQGRTWVCLDRGGKVVRQGGTIWLDMLTREALVPYGTTLEVRVIPAP